MSPSSLAQKCPLETDKDTPVTAWSTILPFGLGSEATYGLAIPRETFTDPLPSAEGGSQLAELVLGEYLRLPHVHILHTHTS